MRSSTVFGAGLVTLWVLGWGSLTWANLITGVIVAVAVFVALPEVRRGQRVIVRPVPLARLVGRTLRDVVASNALLAREVLQPRPRIRTAVVRVPLPGCSDAMLTALTNIVAMTPGTMPVDVEDDPPAMFVHVLQLGDVDRVRREIGSLHRQMVRAFGTPEEIAAAEAGDVEAGGTGAGGADAGGADAEDVDRGAGSA
jgi:multicomponent Na+:H+ antiporter subunit E